ncbi:hypothetical protein LTR86_001405 [Recurvomyces mirabilis]|nr:hypothetical protein LTR86_001405 [Recurvomyces mirabilis]
MIPGETRRRIFELAIGKTFAYVRSYHTSDPTNTTGRTEYYTSFPHHGILFTCMRFYQEAIKLYYAQTTFVVFCTNESFLARTLKTSPTLVHWLRRLQLPERGLKIGSIRFNHVTWQVRPGTQIDFSEASRQLRTAVRAVGALRGQGVRLKQAVLKVPVWTGGMEKVWMGKSELEAAFEREEARLREMDVDDMEGALACLMSSGS